jgi:hypothetical protein
MSNYPTFGWFIIDWVISKLQMTMLSFDETVQKVLPVNNKRIQNGSCRIVEIMVKANNPIVSI